MSEKNNDIQTANAIILANNFNVGLVPLTLDKPIGKLKLNNELIIERLIKQLKAADINDITLVVGYKSEAYAYLEDKFNVDLVFDVDYKNQKLFDGLNLVTDKLENTFIINSNTYFEQNIFLLEVYESLIVYDNDSKTFCYGYINNDISSELRSIFKKQSFKEVDIVNLGINTFFSDQIGSLVEVSDLVDIDKDVLANNNNDILATIAKVFSIEINEIFNIHQMNKGMTNLSFIFTIKAKEYVFRVPGAGTDLLITRSQEAQVYEKIKNLNISDEIVYIDDKKGYKITKYYPNITTVDPYNKKEVKLAMQKVRKLHEANLQIGHKFDILERIEYYKKICTDLNVTYSDEYHQLNQEIQPILAYIKTLKLDRLVHVDPVCENFLVFKDDSIKLIDWEYAGMGHPVMDIAMFVIYQPLSQEAVNEVLQIYLERAPEVEELKTYYAFIATASYLWYFWTIYKAALGDHFGEYADSQLKYSFEYCEKFKKMTQY